MDMSESYPWRSASSLVNIVMFPSFTVSVAIFPRRPSTLSTSNMNVLVLLSNLPVDVG